jgi:hypothetical protein
MHVKDTDGLRGNRYGSCISLNESAKKLVRLTSSFYHDVVISHLLEKTVANKAVTS